MAINWIDFQKTERERHSLNQRQGDLIAEWMQLLAENANWLYLRRMPLSAPYGRCDVCLAPLDCDGDCVECAGRELEITVRG